MLAVISKGQLDILKHNTIVQLYIHSCIQNTVIYLIMSTEDGTSVTPSNKNPRIECIILARIITITFMTFAFVTFTSLPQHSTMHYHYYSIRSSIYLHCAYSSIALSLSLSLSLSVSLCLSLYQSLINTLYQLYCGIELHCRDL